MMFSQEQSQYIYFEGNEDTKLLATAGSGKTFCIIHHMRHLVNRDIVEPRQVYMLTFSKNAKDDFRARVRKYEATKEVVLKNICTIDSFAYSMFGQAMASTIDVSLLSYAWMDELENHDAEYLLAHYPRLENIKMIFVDEAQDLNEIQYRILVRMKAVCDCTIHMVGDPNQNIYQFRKSSDKYLVNFPAKTFYLTKNYRSEPHIVEFCSYLRPYNNVSVSAESPRKCKLDITFYSYDTSSTFEHIILPMLNLFRERRIPLHKCAILAPTRGYIRNPMGVCKYRGLCYIANLLYQHQIPFTQFYSDTNPNDPDAFEATKIKYKPCKDHINLMTYTSSKGLEWDYVIIIDANAHLISRVEYDEAKYLAERYLLYVACSRPRKNLIIFTKSRYANPWFKELPAETYKISPKCRDTFAFFDTSLLYEKGPPTKTVKSVINSPYSLVSNLTIDQLYGYDKQLRGKHMLAPIEASEVDCEVSIPESKAPFMRFYLTHLYYVTAKHEPLPSGHNFVVDVSNSINSKNILLCASERVMSWYYENRENLDWEAYDAIKDTLDNRITTYISSRLDREQPFGSYTLVDKFYELYIQGSMQDIHDLYEKYRANPVDPLLVLGISRIAYAIRTTHYFYIKQEQDFKDSIYTPNITTIKELTKLAEAHHSSGFLDTVRLFSAIDGMYFNYDRARDSRHINVRTKNCLSIKDILQGIVIQYYINPGLPFTEFYSMQLSPPALFKYTITITPAERKQIVESLLQNKT